jgi:AraC family transcriptional activator of pobA
MDGVGAIPLNLNGESAWASAIFLSPKPGCFIGFKRWHVRWCRKGILSNRQREGDERISRVLGILDRSLGVAFPADEIETVSGLTLGQANRLAHRALGVTLNQYWEERRSKAAQTSLAEPGARIKEIALDLGFTELSHFSAWFKRHNGQSPRTWQRNRQ